MRKPVKKRTARTTKASVHTGPSERDLEIGSVSDDLNTQAAFASGLSDAVRGHGDLTGSNVSGLLALVDVQNDRLDDLAARLRDALQSKEAS